MNTIPHNIRYCEHDLLTRYNSCRLYKGGNFSIRDVCRRYKISKASLMRWMKFFDGDRNSLISKSRRPITPHPNAHNSEEIKHIKDLLKRNPNIGLSELYGKLKKNYAYTRHPSSLFRYLRTNGVYRMTEHKKSPYVPKKYHTPTEAGIKMQLDVKFVPKSCFSGKFENHYFQYTIIDEATRERFLYAYNEHSGYSTVDFVKRAIIYFGYIPKMIQTDNGFEFTNSIKTKRIHFFDTLCNDLNIEHRLIRPYTPRHNGKVERSHRNDQARFYNHLSFYSLDDLNYQMKLYLKRSNNIPSSPLKWLSPIETRNNLLTLKHYNNKPIQL
jgi:transposase InsO family protein